MTSEYIELAVPAEKLPPAVQLGPVGWLRQNLFSSWTNSILTLLALWLIYQALGGLFNWAVRFAVFSGTSPEPCKVAEGACWPLVNDNWQIFMVGSYPLELRFRPLIALIIVLAVVIPIFVKRFRSSRLMQIAWVLSPVIVFLVISGSETLGITPVPTARWGGLLLTVLLSITGIVCAFPIGLMLALGRRSKLPIIRSMCVVYIELIRGVPLISVLFMASFMLPLFFPAGFTIDKLLRAQIGIIMFAAAYQAETVRGGLQALSKGQEEAAMSLGLNYAQTMVFIILPQALRNVIPILVSGAISLLKDTSLVVIIGMFDLMGMANTIVANPTWLGKHVESYAFVAGVYWVICFSMSRYARHLEIKFSTGQH
ncbi:MAG: amino acid ABC transporter permease [SAR324 cluster bacterium]|nr:amino acid ABC transporter permease [SAR324 cluster bacterium]